MLGPFATASRRTPHYYSPGVATVASHAACASMSTTTTTTKTTTTTRDRENRYGPMEWAQLALLPGDPHPSARGTQIVSTEGTIEVYESYHNPVIIRRYNVAILHGMLFGRL